MSKISRNAPCPCGSGKKFKKCCLPKQAETPPPVNSYHDHCLELADSLFTKIFRFMEKNRYDNYLKKASREYWPDLDPAIDLEADERELMQFMDWYMHDYPIPGQGRPVIQLYWESRPKLSPQERQVLQDWQNTYVSVFQIIEIEPGEGAWAEDIFSGEKTFISDEILTEHVMKWELMLLRKIKVLEEWHTSTVAGPEPPQYKEEIRGFVEDHFRAYKQENPDADLPTFLRNRGHLLCQVFLNIESEAPPAQEIFTSSGEELLFCEADYELNNLREAVNRLDREEDFERTATDDEESTEVFEWLERGRSRGRVKDNLPSEGLSLQSFLTPGPGHESHRVLGTIILEPDQLSLMVQGEERLALGKEILEEVLAGLISHRQDSVNSLESMLQSSSEELLEELEELEDAEDLEEDIPPELEQALLQDLLDNHYRQWLDKPLPALKGQTPRQAVQNPEGRCLAEDLLRVAEYTHACQDLDYDVSWLRRELKL